MFELEKFKAQANMEKDSLCESKRELNEQLENSKKKIENLVRENEKLRHDSKQKKLFNSGTSSIAANSRYMMSNTSSMTGAEPVLRSAMNRLNSNHGQ